MLINLNLKSINKYIHAQEVTVTKANPVLDTDLLSAKGKVLLQTLTDKKYYFSLPISIKEELQEEIDNPIVIPPVFGITSGTAIINQDDDIILTVVVHGDVVELEVDHNYGPPHQNPELLPEFTVYASESNVWGDPESEQDADNNGIISTYNANTKTFTITLLHDGIAKGIIDSNGTNVEWYLAVKHTNGTKSHTMNGNDYFHVITQ